MLLKTNTIDDKKNIKQGIQQKKFLQLFTREPNIKVSI